MTTEQDSAFDSPQLDPGLERYLPQMLCSRVGVVGQRRLLESRAILIGCGGLGTALADTLVRAGVGHLRICDRDYIEPGNLHRQTLFDENDIGENLPKAEAAARKLTRINTGVTVEPVVVDVNPGNVARLAEGAEVLLDGTDNFETRFLINDLAVKTLRPWVYGAVLGVTGLVMTIVPGETACLRCVFDEPPPPESNPTCDTVGVLGPAVSVVAGLQAIEALKLLTGRADEVSRSLISVDSWTGRVAHVDLRGVADKTDCRCCKHREFIYLAGQGASISTVMCGRSAVQVSPAVGRPMNFVAVAERLKPSAREVPVYNRFMLRAKFTDCELTLFPDGRAIIKGVDDADKARALYSKYIGA